jgi:hypothetical protein
MHGGALQVLNVPDSVTLLERSGAAAPVAAAPIDWFPAHFQS